MRYTIVVFFFAALSLMGQEPSKLDTRVFKDTQQKRKMLDAYFRTMSRPKPPVFPSKAAWDKRRKEVRQLVQNDLGLNPLPERVPLDARIVATKEYDDYRLERIWFRTLPKVWASGWLYVPKGEPTRKYPTILNPHGHLNEGARHPVVQSRCIALAKKGYVAFSVDSVHVTHWPLGVCSVGMMTWNNMRALDYLETRSEVDKTKFGCTGESGGGQQTMYLMALEDRIQVAVPAVLISYFERILFASEDTHCYCNHVPFLLRHTDEPEIVALFAPKPALYISVTGDWTAQFPKEEYPHIAAIYNALGVPERVASRHFTSGHDYSKSMREAMYAWFNKWLKGIDDPNEAKEPAIKTEPPEGLRAMDKPPADNRGEAGIIEYFRERRIFQEPALGTRQDWDRYQHVFRAQVFDVLGENANLPPDGAIDFFSGGPERNDSWNVEKVEFSSAWRFYIPALLFHPQLQTPGGKAVALVLVPGGKQVLVSKYRPFLDSLLQRGFLVFAPDVRFQGELHFRWDLNTIIWGRPETGMAVHDLMHAVFYLRDRKDLNINRIYCVGLGDMGVTALLSGIRDPRIAAVAADDFGTTYRRNRERPLLPHLLRSGDLPQVAALLAPRPLWLNRAVPAEEFNFTRNAYNALDGKTALHLPNLEPAAARQALTAWLADLAFKGK